MKKIVIVIMLGSFFSACFAEDGKITAEELAELRKNPDTSRAVWITEEDKDNSNRTSPEEEQGLILGTKGNVREDPNNPGVFIGDPDEPETPSKKAASGIVFGKMRGEQPSAKIFNSANPEALYNGIDLDQHALRILARCEPSNTRGGQGMAVINLDDGFYVIPTKTGTLPPMPGPEGNLTILGVDVNKNCVRDDVEHLIFELYGLKEQDELRKHLYAHAIWLHFYLIDGISDESIQAVSRQILKTGLCINKKLGFSDSKRIQTEIFALMHNTDARTMRYFDNEDLLTSFDVDTTAPPGC